jgi:hypothetical protein
VISKEALTEADRHWAVSATGDSRLEALALASDLHVRRSLIGLVPESPELSEPDLALLERVATAYELAAVEALPLLLQPFVLDDHRADADRSRAAASRAFDLYRSRPVPDEPQDRIFFVLHVVGLGYAADRWTDVRRWLNESGVQTAPVLAESWDQRVLQALFGFWIALVRKDGWEQLAAIEAGVAELRREQAEYEPILLEERKGSGSRGTAFTLVSLYHWAKGTEILGTYLATGSSTAPIASLLDQHFEQAAKSAGHAGDAVLEVLLRWLHVAARQMAAGAIWSAAQGGDAQVDRFIKHLARSQALFEFLPPQRAALQEMGLLDQASRAVVVDLPTSGGKTALAEFRILQALNQFSSQGGWVAYVAPTRALVSQIARRLRSDFQGLEIEVEALTSAVEIDSFENRILKEPAETKSFDILVLTPEKLNMVIRNEQVSRPLSLVVIDEAQNIEDEDRGLTIELLLATIKRDLPEARFLLLMPFVPNSEDLAHWLSPETGRSISLGASAWKPNDLLVGMYRAEKGTVPGDWSLSFEGLITSRDSVQIDEAQQIGGLRPMSAPWSKAKDNLTTLTAGIALEFSSRGTTVGIASSPSNAWSMARQVLERAPDVEISDSIRLVQRFLATEISPEFELIGMLDKRVAVHHSGLSDDSRALIEWLAESGELSVLCATTTLAQGIDFPVSSVFLSSRMLPSRPPREMSAREFWNLAGRAGRIRHDSLGVVGLASVDSETSSPERIKEYVAQVTDDLVSRLDRMLDELWERGELEQLSIVIQQEQWASFRSYVAHLWAEKKNLEAVLGETEQLLRNTLGYTTMRAAATEAKDEQASALLEATREYANRLAEHPENAVLADSTGFSPEGVRAALLELGSAEGIPESVDDWEPGRLMSPGGQGHLASLIGVMLRVPELNRLESLASSGVGKTQIAKIAQAWVAGNHIEDIAREFFAKGEDPDLTKAITETCKALYRTLANFGSWGIAALSKMPTAGIDFDQLTDEQRSSLNSLPAMLYHGVSTEGGVLMRMNSAPRSVADPLGRRFQDELAGADEETTARHARRFLNDLDENDWQAVAPEDSSLSGADYKQVWELLTGKR